ncbi:autotransporter assembly complex protein TamA [Ketobacter alkanivorans]|nr:autotransporter assembly complex family protein [Ketobacter alkanivorans]
MRHRNARSSVNCILLILIIFMPKLAEAKLKINVVGVDNGLKENVSLHLSNWDAIPEGDEDSIRKAIRSSVRDALQPFGYYEASIKISWGNQSLDIHIEPGPVVVWGKSDINVPQPESGLKPKALKLIQTPPFIVGQPMRHQLYDNYKKELLLSLRQQGYLDANWSQSALQVNLDQHTAVVILHMTLGQRYRINDIQISGSDLSDKTSRQLVNTHAGEWYDTDKVGIIYENLLSSGYFKNAIIDVESTPPNQATLNIELEDQPKDQFTTGIGYGTDTGMRGKLGWTRPKVNARGDNIYSNMQVSQIGEEVTVQYHIPWPHPLERYLSWDTGWKREETTDRESAQLSTGIALKRSQRKQWQYSVGVNLENETYRQGNNPEETITYILPNYHFIERLVYGSSNNPTAILKYWIDSSLGFNVLSDNTLFLSGEIGASYTLDLTSEDAISTRFALGGIMTDDFYSVPLSKRFYTGGDQTVRGYKYNSLAPKDENGELQGGQFLNVFSLEYRYRLNEEWQLATFADTGRTFISSHDPFHSGAGVGLRWTIPVGTFSFDIAKPVTAEEDKSLRLHIYLGMLL